MGKYWSDHLSGEAKDKKHAFRGPYWKKLLQNPSATANYGMKGRVLPRPLYKVQERL